jgi:uncharacterized protein (DUF2237 family)
VIKLDTIQRLAELLKISPLSLLGIGVEYYNRPVALFERTRQAEETADQILSVEGPLTYITSTDAYDEALAAAFEEASDLAGTDRLAARAGAEQVLGILAARKRMYGIRRPSIIAMLPASRMRRFLEAGIAPGVVLSERTRRMCRDVAASEVEHIAKMMEAEPMGLQFGLLPIAEPTGAFAILRARDRATLMVNPFPPDTYPSAAPGVAMITAADEAIAAHQRVAEAYWRDAVKGAAAAAALRKLVAESRAA